MSTQMISDPATEAGEAHRLPRCRRLVTQKHQGRSTAAKVGPPAHDRCSAEVADPHHEAKLCTEHLAAAMRDLVAAGAVLVRAELPVEIREAITQWEIAFQAERESVERHLAPYVELWKMPVGAAEEVTR